MTWRMPTLMRGCRTIAISSPKTLAAAVLVALTIVGTMIQPGGPGVGSGIYIIESDSALRSRELLPINAILMHDSRYPAGQAQQRYDTAMEAFLAWMASSSRYLHDETLEQRLQEGRLPEEPDFETFERQLATGTTNPILVHAIPDGRERHFPGTSSQPGSTPTPASSSASSPSQQSSKFSEAQT